MSSTKNSSGNVNPSEKTVEISGHQQDGKNVTPQLAVEQPVNGLKNIFSLISQFVSVGGDFV